MIANVSRTPIGPGENGLSNALDRERARYHERQRGLLAKLLGKPKRSGVEARGGTGNPVGGTTVGHLAGAVGDP